MENNFSMDPTNDCADVQNFNLENSSADKQYVAYKNASVFLPLQVENSIRRFWKEQNHHSHEENENEEKNKTLNVHGALSDKHGEVRKTNKSLGKVQGELIQKSMSNNCPDKYDVNLDCKTKVNNAAIMNNQKINEIRKTVRTFHGKKTSTAVLREMKLEVSSFSVGDYHIDCQCVDTSFVLKVVLYRRELIYVISMTMPNDSKKNVIANVEIPLSDITAITVTEYDLQLVLNKIPQIRFEVFLKVGLNAKRRIAYPEEFDIFEGNFGMCLVHQIQLKHPECRKLIKKFLKFDKTLESLLDYRKKNSDIIYCQSKISDVDFSLFDSKSSSLPLHKNIRE
ncbi:hypothetical protein T05_7719 [Trichinella murrelli]|uniref:Uncharacterized protein n=1 Tax=Trichinella murrelli TaxID=144512 RepID=A0A0V0TLT1_9BILA|nr:hypothetical protein T05_7719 [Trichinella murrelli]